MGYITEGAHPCPEAAAHAGAATLQPSQSCVLGNLTEESQIPEGILFALRVLPGQFLAVFCRHFLTLSASVCSCHGIVPVPVGHGVACACVLAPVQTY